MPQGPFDQPRTEHVIPQWAGTPLRAPFFERETSLVARELMGCLLLSRKGGVLTGGRIVETEAYLGADDVGSHAATRGITKRNATMFGPPAHTYVYFTYGNHHMLNLVTEPDGMAGAVLIRAIEPLVGIDEMISRRKGRVLRELANGPGKLAAALGLDLSDDACALGAGAVDVLAHTGAVPRIDSSGRVGLSAGWQAQLRYYLHDDPWVSKGRTGPPSGGRETTAEGKQR